MSEGISPDSLEYTLLVVDDEESIRVTLAEALRDEKTRVLAAATGRETHRLLAEENVDLVLLDQNLKESGENGIDVLREIKQRRPETLVIIMTAYGRIESAVEATKLGCFQYITKPIEIPQLRLLIQSALETVNLRKEVDALRRQHEGDFVGESIFGSSEKMRTLIEQVKTRYARTPRTTILIRGETGVGKELIARMIHYYSDQGKGPFLDMNCAAMPEHLLESELFGADPGAFTGGPHRTARKGLLEAADRGCLFLDEIGEMSMSLQAKLLRVLQEHTFRRLGSTVSQRTNARFIAATNKDLIQEVEAKRFREDLYYRLSVIPIYVPALRDRKEDIAPLAHYFLERSSREMGARIERISDKAMEILSNYRWPGNVRELRNVMELVAVTHGTGNEILPDDLPPHIRGAQTGTNGTSGQEVVFLTDRVLPLADVESAAIQHALEKVQGNKTRAALALGISRQTLRTKIDAYHLRKADDDDAD